MRTRPMLAIAILALLTACADGPAPVEPEPRFMKGGTGRGHGGPPLLATSVTAGRHHACAIGTDRATYCWGDNSFGQLGDGSGEGSTTPVPVAGSSSFDELTSGGWNHTCALTDAGEAWCWGQNGFGQLGDGTTVDRGTPVRAAPGLTFSSLDAGTYHTCGITNDGTTHCWGANGPLVHSGDQPGFALGSETTTMCDNPHPEDYRGARWPCSPTPVALPGPAFTSVDAGFWATCGRTTAGSVSCVGWNVLWNLGNGTADNVQTLTPVSGGLSFDAMNLGAVVGCGLADASAHCWGARFITNGMVGNGTMDGSSTPSPVAGGHSFASVHPSDANNIFSFVCGVTTSGEALCWGNDRLGALGTRASLDPCPTGSEEIDWECSAVPVPVTGDHTFTDLATGSSFACGVERSRHVYCWGANGSGQLGDGTSVSRSSPVQVQAPDRVNRARDRARAAEVAPLIR